MSQMLNELMLTLEELQKLMRSELKLECLIQNGVDNWVGYGDAMEQYEELIKGV